MNLFGELLVKTLAVFVTGYILSAGISIPSIWVAVVIAIVLGVLNTFLKPFLVLITLPVNIFTLGLFTFVINALIVMLAAWIVPGFIVANFWWALLFALILSLVSGFLQMFVD